MRRLILTAMVVAAAAGCTAGRQATQTTTGRPSSATANGPTGQRVPFEFFGSPAPAGRRCPTPSREAGAYTVLIGPTSGKAGSKVIVAENTPLFDEAGRYRGPRGKIGFWFVDVPFRSSEIGYTAQGAETASAARVVHLGEASVAGQCSYRVAFTVPKIAPGVYGIVAIEHRGRGFAALGRPIEFRVEG